MGNLKWAVFLMSLKDVIETGTGNPFPNDIHIDHDEQATPIISQGLSHVSISGIYLRGRSQTLRHR